MINGAVERGEISKDSVEDYVDGFAAGSWLMATLKSQGFELSIEDTRRFGFEVGRYSKKNKNNWDCAENIINRELYRG